MHARRSRLPLSVLLVGCLMSAFVWAQPSEALAANGSDAKGDTVSANPLPARILSDLFISMPDSLLPLLSQNNRLDMLDFMEAGMEAEVTNLLNGRSVMTLLTADSLSVQLTEASRLDLKLVQPAAHGVGPIVRVIYTYGNDTELADRRVKDYTRDWVPCPDLR